MSANIARELHAAAKEKGFDFLDAPVSGGQAGAVNGALTVMCGGDAAPFAAMQPVALSFARAVTRVGPSGSGQLAKMVNQVAIVGMVQALAEALAFGKRAGLDMPLVLDVIGKGAAQSWQMDNRGKTMLEERFDFGFAVDWMRKDLGLVLDEARRTPPLDDHPFAWMKSNWEGNRLALPIEAWPPTPKTITGIPSS